MKSTVNTAALIRASYQTIGRPLLFALDPETAHDFIHAMLGKTSGLWKSLSGSLTFAAEELSTEFCGMKFANPVGLAAGFDKNACLVNVLACFGFGFVEVGSITARASQGNPRPRLFRLPEDKALINFMGLNGQGADRVTKRLAALKPTVPVGVNIAKTHDPEISGDAAIEDILYTFERVRDLDIRYVTINASCPNTAEGIVEEKQHLAAVFAEVQKRNQRKLPIFVKLSPDSSDGLINNVIEESIRHDLAGYVCTNTSSLRPDLATPSRLLERMKKGGLSGRPLKKPALAVVKRVYELKSSNQAIIGVGGISSGQDAYDFITAGANALQLYTALVYQGPTAVRDINKELLALLNRDCLTVQEAVGVKRRSMLA